MAQENLTTLYIVRHGESDWNTQKIIQGHNSKSALTEKGREQAQGLAEKLRDIHFDAVFSSDLLRAKQTAEIIALEKNLAVKTTELLRERNFGKYEGQPWGSDNEIIELLAKYHTLTDEQKSGIEQDGVETNEQMLSRFITFVREIAAGYIGQTVLVITHGGIIARILVHLGWSSGLRRGSIQNAAHVKLKSDGVDFFLEEVNGVAKK